MIMFIWTRNLYNAFRQSTVYVGIGLNIIISELFRPVEKNQTVESQIVAYNSYDLFILLYYFN